MVHPLLAISDGGTGDKGLEVISVPNPQSLVKIYKEARPRAMHEPCCLLNKPHSLTCHNLADEFRKNYHIQGFANGAIKPTDAQLSHFFVHHTGR